MKQDTMPTNPDEQNVPAKLSPSQQQQAKPSYSGGVSKEQDSSTESKGRYGYGYGYEKTPMGPNLPAALSKPPDAKSLLKALRRRWMLALVLGSIGAAVTASMTANLSPTKYQADASILIATKVPYSVYKSKDDNFATYKQAQIKKINSTEVLEKAVFEHPEIEFLKEQSDPVGWLRDNLKIRSDHGSELVTISLTSISESSTAAGTYDYLVEMVNAVVDAYYDHAVTLDKMNKRKDLDDLALLHRQQEEKIWNKQERIQELARKRGFENAEEAGFKTLLASLNYQSAERERQELRIDLDDAQVRMELAQRTLKNEDEWAFPQSKIDARIVQDPTIIELKSKIEGLSLGIEQMTRVVQDTKLIDPLRSKKEAYEKTLRSLQQDKLASVIGELKENRRHQLEEELNQEKNRIARLQTRMKFLDQQSKDYLKEAERLAKSDGEVEFERESLAVMKETRGRISRDKEALDVELNSPPRVKLIDRADAAKPLTATGTNTSYNSMFLAFFVLSVVFLCVAFLEFHFRRVDSAQDVAQLGIPVLGGLPIVPNALRDGKTPSAKAIGKTNASKRFMESMDEVRTLLLRDAQLRDSRILMVTSADAMEGKTTLSMYLSISLAYAGQKVLLMDCDLRRPSIHRRFGLPRLPGLGDALLSAKELDHTIRPTSEERLWVMPAGRVDREVFRALAQDELGEIIRTLSGEYDFIIIDTPPTLPVADALQIGQQVDATLITALRNVTQTPKLYSAIEKLGAVDIQILGAVVQGISRLEYYRYERQYRLSPSPHTLANQSSAPGPAEAAFSRSQNV